jgi:hypothetical protein
MTLAILREICKKRAMQNQQPPGDDDSSTDLTGGKKKRRRSTKKNKSTKEDSKAESETIPDEDLLPINSDEDDILQVGSITAKLPSRKELDNVNNDIKPKLDEKYMLGLAFQSLGLLEDEPSTDKQKAEHRLAFKKAFDEDKDNTEGKTKTVTEVKYETMITAVIAGEKNKLTQKQKQNFRVRLIQFTNAESNTESNTDPQHVIWRKTKDGGRYLMRESQIFDAIYAAHMCVGHMGVKSTGQMGRQTVWNMPEKYVTMYIKGCEICKQRKTKQEQEHKVGSPLEGTLATDCPNKYRDLFQVDFIDMNYNPKRNSFGVMNWVVIVRDHFTGIVFLDCIPKKTPNFVVIVLERAFGILGFPQAMTICDGLESDSQMLIGRLKETNPQLTTVVGAPITQEDNAIQGTAVRVWSVLDEFESNQKERGIPPNWTKGLGYSMFTLNGKSPEGIQGVSAYHTVFGMECTPISVSEPVNQQEPVSEPTNSSFWESVDSDLDESSFHSKHTSLEVELVDSEPEVEILERATAFASLRKEKREFISIDEAWATGHTTALEKNFHWVQAELQCNCVHVRGEMPLLIASDPYLVSISSGNAWWDHSFMTTYIQMCAHSDHRKDLRLVHMYEHEAIGTVIPIVLQDHNCGDVPTETELAFSIIYSKSICHFVVLEIDFGTKTCQIYDGKSYPLSTWTSHAKWALQLCRKIPALSDRSFKVKEDREGPCYHYDDDDGDGWNLIGPSVFVQQKDDHSCGPIASLFVMHAFGRLSPDVVIKDLTPDEIRRTVTEDYKKVLSEVKNTREVSVTFKKKKNRKQQDNVQKAQIGDRIAILPDKLGMEGGQEFLGVVFGVGKEGSCEVVTNHGILCESKKCKDQYLLPIHSYKVLHEKAYVGDKLEKLRSNIVEGTFIPTRWKRRDIQDVHGREEKDSLFVFSG